MGSSLCWLPAYNKARHCEYIFRNFYSNDSTVRFKTFTVLKIGYNRLDIHKPTSWPVWEPWCIRSNYLWSTHQLSASWMRLGSSFYCKNCSDSSIWWLLLIVCVCICVCVSLHVNACVQSKLLSSLDTHRSCPGNRLIGISTGAWGHHFIFHTLSYNVIFWPHCDG